MRYYQPTNSLYLANDAGTAVMGPITVGSGTLSNSQCTLDGAATTVSGSGATLTLALALTSKGFVGAQNVYLIALSTAKTFNSGWQSKGVWTPAPDTGPTNGTVSPNPATGLNQTFTATWSASSGGSYTGLRGAYVVINSTLAGADSLLRALLSAHQQPVPVQRRGHRSGGTHHGWFRNALQ